MTIDSINGVPLHQLGTSKQILARCLIAHALNPRSAFVLVDGREHGKADRRLLATPRPNWACS